MSHRWVLSGATVDSVADLAGRARVCEQVGDDRLKPRGDIFMKTRKGRIV